MPPSKPRTWSDGLDNLGENFIRLGTALKAIESAPESTETDTAFAGAVGQLADRFGVAFRQAQPVLVASERSFLDLVPSGEAARLPLAVGEEHPEHARTLVHEGILAAREIVSLLDRVLSAGTENPAVTRQLLEGSLRSLAESSSTVGWELKAVCHEYLSEEELAGGPPATIEGLGPGSVGLIHEMASAARRVRSARREWYRVYHRLTAATGDRRP